VLSDGNSDVATVDHSREYGGGWQMDDDQMAQLVLEDASQCKSMQVSCSPALGNLVKANQANLGRA
jgi:hypothetical protein